MTFKIQLIACSEDSEEEVVQEIAELDKDFHRIEHLGLTLAEAKELLKEIQKSLVQQQVQTYLDTRMCCSECGTELKTKGHHTIQFRTLFGTLSLDSPRLYTCHCRSSEKTSFSPLAILLSERVAPELLFMETKWASLVSYGMTVDALKDFLPIDEKLNAATVRNHTMAVAERCEKELGDEQVFFVEGCRRDWKALPPPDGPITVGIDGGYLRKWDSKKKNFEVIVGKSIPETGSAKCFGLVQTYDTKPKRRLFELLRSQGIQMNQDVCFLSDGEDAVRELQWYLNPQAEHMLDWFHITMHITVLGQYVKGLIGLDTNLGEKIRESLELTKWNLGYQPDWCNGIR